MSIFDNPDQLRLLKNLLYPTERRDFDVSDSDDDESLVRNNLTPANIGPEQHNKEANASKKKKRERKNTVATALKEEEGEALRREPQSVEEWQEMQEKQDAEVLETRKRPEYTMHYRQAVGTEDVFLQMGNRTAATASCEDLILEIRLPEETVKADKMQLSIKQREIDLATPMYRLNLPLVQPVNVDRCRAQYDADVRKLCLTLRLQRELDFVNF